VHPFDFPASTKTVRGAGSDYYNFIDQTYFQNFKNQRILEIAPFVGLHSKLIANKQPKYFKCIEGDQLNLEKLKQIPNIDEIVIDDAWLAINKEELFDIVICYGLLYHHHSSLQLIEQIVNFCKPKYLLIDCVTAEHPLAYNAESAGSSGNRQVRNNWKQAGVNLKTPFFIINQSMFNMDYQLEQAHHMNFDDFSKNNSWVASWKIKE
jgi:SAM-dependent methyltransferase